MTELVDATDAAGLEFRRVSHVKYLKSMLSIMPSPYISLDTSRLTALYFCVVGLDMLDELNSIDKGQVVEFI
jgi:prenyltransferase beta subunit